MKTNSIKAAHCFILTVMATLSLQANNQVSWGSVHNISADSDVNTSGTLVGTYSPYLILNPGVSSITVNGVTFVSNSVNAVTVDMTNAVDMGINASLTDPNYADLLSGASDTPFNTSGSGELVISNLVVGDSYQVEVWAENVNEPSYDQWENFYTVSSSSTSGAVNYDHNSSETGAGIGQYVIGTFTATNNTVQITSTEWSEVWGSGTINHNSGQGQINLLELRLVGTPAPQNQVTWGSVTAISSDSDVVTNGILVGTWSPYLLLNPSVSPLAVNGLTFQSNTLKAVTFGMTNSTTMGINSSLSDPNYANLLSGASDTPFNTSGSGYILFSNVVPGAEYEIQIWAENVNEPTYDQWENLWTVSTSDQTGAVNYDNNGSQTGGGIGEYVTGTFTPTVSNSVVQISWEEWSEVWGSGTINSDNGQGQINLLTLLLLENPPTITAQPAATTYAASGTNVTITATAGGSPTLYYQWYETNLTALTGFSVPSATNASLTLSNLTASDNYFLVVTNAYGSTNSAIASVIVYTSPLIIGELPVDYTNPFTLYAGASPAFSVSALGLTSLSYQWFTNGVLDGTAIGSSLTLPDVKAGASISNYCIVNNSYGSATSVVWTASVIATPLAPYPQTVMALNPIGYWRMNDASLDGADNGNGDNGYICHDYAGGNDGMYTNAYIGQSDSYNPVSDPSDSSAQFGEESLTDFGDSLAFGIEGINFGSPANTSVAFTVEAWASAFSQNSDAGIVTLGWGNGGEQFNLDCGSDTAPTTHGFRFLIRDAAGNTHGTSSSVSTPTTGQSQWYHLVGVVDEISNQNVTFYINGQSVGSSSCPAGSGILASTYPMGIGSRMGSQTTNFNNQFLGNINDVAVYNYALSPGQVAAQYAAGGTNVAPFFVPAPPTTASAGAGTTLTIPVAAYGNGPLGYVWTNLTTDAVVTGGNTAGASLNATLAYPNVPEAWNGDQLQLTVTNAYGSATALVTLSVVNISPVNIGFTTTNNQLHLSWPSDHAGWMLQVQTNRLSVGISTNWVNVTNSTGTNLVIVPVNLNNGTVFYRLAYP